MVNKIKDGLSVLKLHSKNVLLEILPEKGARIIRYRLKTKDNTFELLRPVNPLVLFEEKQLQKTFTKHEEHYKIVRNVRGCLHCGGDHLCFRHLDANSQDFPGKTTKNISKS